MKALMQLDHVLLRNPLSDWLIAVGIVVAIVLVVTIVKRVVVRRLSVVVRRQKKPFYEAVIIGLKATKPWLVLVVALDFGSQYLQLPHKTDAAIDRATTIAVFLQVGLWLAAVLQFWLTRSRLRAMETDAGAATSLAAFSFIGQLLLWTVMLLLALDNLGVNVTALVASLGVGGIAVALAVQNILGDLFASLSIVIDKPFVIGDAIVVDSFSGTVEHVGLKTTRVRSSTGEQLVFSNSDLLKARLRNYKRMQERCITFSFGVPYQTGADQLEKIPEILRGIIEGRDKVRFDRAHFKDFANAAHTFEVVYWMLDPDYKAYMDAQQSINLAIIRALEKAGIGLAYPTQRMFIDGPAGLSTAQIAPKLQARG